MKKNKKGFTLIEIIICIVLIVLIGGISLISLKSSSEDDTKKTINEVITSADVYYSMNQELKNKLEANSGYLVLSVEELKKTGMLSTNLKIPEDEALKSYDKLVIISKDDSNAIKGLSEEELGLVDIIYPYEKTEPFIFEIEPLYIEYFEKNNFECSSKLDFLRFMNENYEVIKKTNDYLCNFDKSEDELNSDENQLTKNEVEYSIEDGSIKFTRNRMVYVNPEPDIKIKANYQGETEEYVCGTWTNKNIKLKIIDTKGGVHQSDKNTYEWKKGEENVGTGETIIVEESGDYKGNFKLYGNISSGETREYEKSCEINIDKINPEITLTYDIDTLKGIKISDSDSGLYGYYLSENQAFSIPDEDYVKLSSMTQVYTLTADEIEKNGYTYIYVKDNAGNVSEKEIITDNSLPNVEFIPIKDSFSKFKIEINSPSEIENVIINEIPKSLSEICIPGNTKCTLGIDIISKLQSIIDNSNDISKVIKSSGIKFDDLFDYKQKYTLEIKLKNNIKVTYKMEPQIIFNTSYIEEMVTGGSGKYSMKMLGINSEGNFIFERIQKSSSNPPNTYFYHDVKKGDTIELISKSDPWDSGDNRQLYYICFNANTFNEKEIKYTLYRQDYHEIEKYTGEYKIINGNLTGENSKTSYDYSYGARKRCESANDCCETSYYGDSAYKLRFTNEDLKSEPVIRNYMNLTHTWENNDGNSYNYDYNLEYSYLFKRNDNAYSVIVRQKGKTASDISGYDYYMLNFKTEPQITITNKTIENQNN